MTVNDIWTYLGVGGAGLAFVLMGLIKIKPLEISVWSWLLRKLGKALNGETNDRLDTIEKTLTDHMATDAEKEALHNRTMILRFADEMFDGKYHSQDHFEEILERIDKYEDYCREHEGFKNGRTAASEEIIKDQYRECLQRHSFKMKKKEDDSND